MNKQKVPLEAAPQETAFEAVGQMFRSRKFSQVPRLASGAVLGKALVSLNDAEHRARRAAENRLFSAEALQRYERDVLEPHMERAFAALEIGGNGLAKLDIPPFVTALILNISLVLIGIDQRDSEARRVIFSYTEPLIAAHEVEWNVGDNTETLARAVAVKNEYWTNYIEPAYRRRQAAIAGGGWTEPPDLLSVLAEMEDMDDDIVAQEACLYLVASVLTSTSTVTNATELLIAWLRAHPEDRPRALDRKDDFLLRAVEETLRVRPPVNPLIGRVATERATVGGQQVEAGVLVGMNIVESNLDPAVYPDDPDAFKPLRTPAIDTRRTHYSFGEGSHICIGKPLVIGDARAGTVGDAIVIVRGLIERGVQPSLTEKPRLAPTSRRRYVSFPATVEPAKRISTTIEVEVADVQLVGQHTKIVTLAGVDGALPEFTAGAHIDVEIPGVGNRSYSIANSPEDRNRYVIGVRREVHGRGGSDWVFTSLGKGDRLHIRPPSNTFPLDETSAHTLFIAGGIGITPLLSMAHRLSALGKRWSFWYTAKNDDQLVFAAQLQALAGADRVVNLHATDKAARIDLQQLLRAHPDATIYACGPTPLLQQLLEIGGDRLDDIHVEFFQNTAEKATDKAYEVELTSTGERIRIPAGKTILEVLLERGMDLPYSCMEGTCGACEVGVVSGEPDHRDAVLTPREREAGKSMMICVSGCKGRLILLDL
ncbi:cytochrome P450 [Achromobacter aloeverae]